MKTNTAKFVFGEHLAVGRSPMRAAKLGLKLCLLTGLS